MSKIDFISLKTIEFCDDVRDGTHDSPKHLDSGKLLITSKNIKGDSIDFENASYISEEDFNKINERSLVEINDVLYSMIGTVGLVYRVEQKPNYAIKNMGLFKIHDELKSKWLYYYLNSPKAKRKVLSMLSGSTQKFISLSNLRNLEIEFPRNIEDAKKIINICESIDNKIRLNNQINNNLFDLGRTYFEDFISNCDEEVAIKDIADEVLDYTKNNNDKVKLLNSSDITENIFPKVEFIDNKDLKGHFKKRFKKYDILYSQIRPRNHHYGYVLLDDSENYLASTRFMVVRNKKEKVSSSLLYYYLTSKNAVEDFTTKTELRSGTFPQGNYEDLSSYVIRYSSNQELITKILDSILETINYNNNENEKLVELRDTLLPKLMNGEIDLDNIDI